MYPGSILIDQIQFNNLKFLGDTILSSISNDNFDLVTGKPLTNIQTFNNNNIHDFFVTTSNSLKESTDISNNFIYTYPSVLDPYVGRDLVIGEEETNIDIVFLFEGASMKNMMGYYMYYIDENNQKCLLTNDTDNQGYHYSPTIIFPHVYSNSSDNSLKTGEYRRLIGNLPNGKFSNICVGFFIVQHGWFAFEQQSIIPSTNFLYTTTEFNKKNIQNIQNKIVNDKIFSVFARAVTDSNEELLFTGFEDAIGTVECDMDYNDCVFGIVASKTSNIINYPDFTKVYTPDTSTQQETNNIIYYDDYGEFVVFPSNNYNINNNNDHLFERYMNFTDSLKRDSCYNLCLGLHKNYSYSVRKENSNGKYSIVMSHLFRKNDLKNEFKLKGSSHKSNDSNDDDEKNNNSNNGNSKLSSERYEIYLYQSKYDTYDKVINYKKVIFECTNDPNYSESYKLTNLTTKKVILDVSGNISPPVKLSNYPFRVIGCGIMDCINGRASISSSIKAIYNIYKSISDNKGLVINIKMDDHPKGFLLNNKYFVRYVCFYVNMNEHVIVDLGNLNLYQEVNDSLVLNNYPSLTNIKISEIVHPGSETIKDLISIFRANINAIYRKITINDCMTFYCISFSNNKNNPTMIYLDTSNYFVWNDKNGFYGGTYFVKQKVYIKNKFVSL